MDENKQQTIGPGLYLVSTPIGNMEDITYRALNVLKKSDIILCEDTRRSGKLLSHFKIKNKLLPYHKFNEVKVSTKIVDSIKENKIISLISDAGTPSISDPGRIIINECLENNIDVYPVPGPSAVTAAVSISGFSEKYFFYGFFPEKSKNLSKDFKILSNLDCSIVFFVPSKKINKSIILIKKYFSDRKILICREISKFYEEYSRTNIKKLELFNNIPRGEITIVLSEKNNKKNISNKLEESDKKNINKMIKTLSIKDIVNLINHNRDISRKEIYNYCLKLKNEK